MSVPPLLLIDSTDTAADLTKIDYIFFTIMLFSWKMVFRRRQADSYPMIVLLEPERRQALYLGLELRARSSGSEGWLCLLSETGETDFFFCRNHAEIATVIQDSHPTVMAVGSPLTVDVDASGRLKTRQAEKALKLLEHPACLNPRFGPQPPYRYRATALESTSLVAKIKQIAPDLSIIETHAAGIAEFLGLPAWLTGKKKTNRRELTSSFFQLFADRAIMENHLARRAALNAYAAREFSRNRTIAFGNEQEGQIHLPKPQTPRLVILDVDGTLTKVPSPWRHIHQQFGVWKVIGESILSRWLKGEISYDTFCQLDVELWRKKKAKLSEVESILDSIEIRPGVVELLQTLRAKHLKLALLSSGFLRIARRICRSAGMEEDVIVIANRLYENKRGQISVEVNVSGDGNSKRSKGAHVRRLCSQLGISPVNCVGIGDGPSDRHLFERCGQSIMVDESENLNTVVSIIALEK